MSKGMFGERKRAEFHEKNTPLSVDWSCFGLCCSQWHVEQFTGRGEKWIQLNTRIFWKQTHHTVCKKAEDERGWVLQQGDDLHPAEAFARKNGQKSPKQDLKNSPLALKKHLQAVLLANVGVTKDWPCRVPNASLQAVFLFCYFQTVDGNLSNLA